MRILAIDPGPVQSAYVVWDGVKLEPPADEFGEFYGGYEILPNEELQSFLVNESHRWDYVVIEKVACYGMAVGENVFETVFWTGKFCGWMVAEDAIRMPRKDVKMHLCGSMRAKDSNIRQALIDRFGPPGTKKAPGLTYGLKKDLWQAFALAVTYYDQNCPQANAKGSRIDYLLGNVCRDTGE